MIAPSILLAWNLLGHTTADKLIAGAVVVAGNRATYTDTAKAFSISTPKGWWFRDDYRDSEGLHFGQEMVGGAAGQKTWDPSFVVIKLKIPKSKDYLKLFKTPQRDYGPLTTGKVGHVHYKVYWQLGWTYVDAYVEAPKALWEVEVHIPKAGWKKHMPLALDIIRSFRLLNKPIR